MRYAKGSIGRVFLLKFEDGDILIKEIERLARRENIRSATLLFLGALKEGDLATGPKKPVVPPEPNWTKFRDGWEVFGVGSVFSNRGSGPQAHIHTSMGKAGRTLTGCVRKDTKVFLVIEAVVLELKGVKATKGIDPKTGLNLLKIGTGVKF